MEEESTREGATAQDVERRKMPRCPVDEEAVLLLVGRDARVPCRIVELSLTGCRMSTKERFPAAGELRVEAIFKIQGIAFRFGGAIEWADGKGLVGIRFVDLIPRRKDELIEVLCELEAEIAAKAEREAAEKRAAEERARQEAEKLAPMQSEAALLMEARRAVPPEVRSRQAPAAVAASQPAKIASVSISGSVLRSVVAAAPLAVRSQAPVSQPPAPQLASQRPARQAKRERRVQSRHEVDTSADIFLINVGSKLSGRIIDLSAGGCRIRADERFPVGIYTRVETEFRLEGLPFRLGGVIQAVHDRDRRLVGIRFLDMSTRKREQLEQLIEEIEAIQGKQTIARPGGAGEMSVEGSEPENVLQAPPASQRATATDQVEDQHDDRNHDQEVDQASAYV